MSYNGLTRQALIEAVAAGETLSSVEKAYGLKYNAIYNLVKEWGLQGITPEKAQELLAADKSANNRIPSISSAFDKLGPVIELLSDLAQLKTPALQSVIEERQRQNAKWGEQNHPLAAWVSILGEEYGELCEAVNETIFNNGPEAREKGGHANIRAEAVQVAAVAVQLVEMLDRNGHE
ncbi:hypothetical protein ABEX47_03240 [Paenibacillus ehimensis]|uniref:hypothetical protein n=1 Tax=Paenibacillus ehimensis TaxID=79264 RepID=UPI003D2D3E5B